MVHDAQPRRARHSDITTFVQEAHKLAVRINYAVLLFGIVAQGRTQKCPPGFKSIWLQVLNSMMSPAAPRKKLAARHD